MTTALLLIDVQTGVLDGSATPARQPLVDRAQTALIGRLQGVLARARAQGIPVVFVQHNEGPGEPLATGSAGWQLRSDLAPQPGEAVVQKDTWDSFHNTTLVHILGSSSVDHLIVGGFATDFCIDASCRRAVEIGFEVTLLADGHMTGDSAGQPFEEIIAEFNADLDGLSSGGCQITLRPCDAVPGG
ncbi:isochorismatase family protein [Paracoccaceae bacterium Fryx2]|nr:isochorismatase family protein [Paracoccaceae bacterium Fryx2]